MMSSLALFYLAGMLVGGIIGAYLNTVKDDWNGRPIRHTHMGRLAAPLTAREAMDDLLKYFRREFPNLRVALNLRSGVWDRSLSIDIKVTGLHRDPLRERDA